MSSFRRLLLAPLLAAAFDFIVARADVAAAETSCVHCHGSIDLIGNEASIEIVASFAADVHAAVGLSCHDCHGGNADPKWNEDPTAAMDPTLVANPFRGVPSRQEVPAFCGRCHSEPVFMKRYKPDARVDQEKEYWTSRHGELLRQGDPKVATCVDCHSAHGIRRPSDPEAALYPTRVAETCRRCHSDPVRMSGYETADHRPLPIDQYERWSRSVHADALLRREDLSAPTCNTCHGNHGAVPPGLKSIAFVCGQCHVREADLFRSSPKHEGFERHNDFLLTAANGTGCPQCHRSPPESEITSVQPFAECATCHGTHAVMRPTVALLGTIPETPCEFCHEGAPTTDDADRKPRREDLNYERTKKGLLAEAGQRRLEGDKRFDWLVAQARQLPHHMQGGQAGSETRPAFRRLFDKFRIGMTHLSYPDPVTGQEVEEAVVRCTDCHGPQSDFGEARGHATSQVILARMRELTALTARAERILLTAERGGVAIREARAALDEAVDAQIALEALVHTFSVEANGAFETKYAEGVTRARAAIEAGRAALVELQSRRTGLVVSLCIILLVLVGLGLKIRDLARR